MKGVIPRCLCELVAEKYGRQKHDEIMKKAGMDPGRRFLAVEDVEDDDVMKMVQATCDVLGVTLAQAADVFGDYWVNTFAPKLYSAYYRGVSSAREFLLKMDYVHQMSTRNIKNAAPPRFDYEWQDDNTLIMTYKSKRNLIDFLIGLIKGVGRYFNTDLQVQQVGTNRVRIEFPAA
jgi:hypothetical protein